MTKIDEEELKVRRGKLMARYQEYMASLQAASENNKASKPASIGQMSGRFVAQIESCDSKESRLFKSHAMSTLDERIMEGFVNTAKKAEADRSKTSAALAVLVQLQNKVQA